MDIIVKKYFEKFCRQHQIATEDESSNFERFINYCILSTKNISSLDLSSIDTGGKDDCAIDGMAISINNKYISSLTELNDIKNFGMDLDVQFYFIQSKMSANFSGSEILNFGHGVLDLFKPSGENNKRRNENIKEKYKMIESILKDFDYLESPPICNLYYVTTGKWVDDDNLKGNINKVKNDLNNTDLFSKVNFFPYDKDKIRSLYKSSKHQNSARFTLRDKLEIPYIEGIKEGYLALMPVKNIVNILLDEENDRLKKGIFNSNVRDFQGLSDNRVNQDILETINSENRNQFGLLNNGITIVSESLKKSKGRYIIKNFQVVNGCQTSNVLFKNRDKLTEDMWVNVKLIVTDNSKIINSIVKATNNQTEVKEVQLYAMSEYQHLLEDFYQNYQFEEEKLYYERREGQYNSDPSVDDIKVISFEEQLKSFAAIFLEVPHESIRHYYKVVEEVEERIFIKGQKPIIYFTAAYVRYKLKILFNNGVIEKRYRNFRYHMMMIIKKIICKDKKMPQFNSKKMESYCERILNSLYDENEFNDLIDKTMNVLDAVVDVDDREKNKVEYVLNHINMYLDLNITKNDLQRYKAINEELEMFLLTFSKIKKSGDMRFNFIKWLDKLIWNLEQYDFIDFVSEIKEIKNNINTEHRKERKSCSTQIYNKLNEFKDKCIKKIDSSKRYINN